MTSRRLAHLWAATALIGSAACYDVQDPSGAVMPRAEDPGPKADPTPPPRPTPGPLPAEMPPAMPAMPADERPPVDPRLGARAVDYGLALRSASLKLTGRLPTSDDLRIATDAAAYAAIIDRYLADPRFPAQMRAYWRSAMKMSGALDVYVQSGLMHVSLETAPTFAAYLVATDRPMTELFWASESTCPTLDDATGVFTPRSCGNTGADVAAGVLTDPGAMSQNYSNMAFRRVRWIQETFACGAFPAESTGQPRMVGGALYLSPWPFESVSGGNDPLTAPVDFRDTSGIVCANCHSTLNHIAPLFAYFDAAGVRQPSIQVRTPGSRRVLSVLTDWIPPGENFAWRHGQVVSHLPGLGRTIAADPAVARCFVARAWNWAMSKSDIVDDLALVPDATIAELVQGFVAGQFKMKAVLKALFTHEDFVKIDWSASGARQGSSADPVGALIRADVEPPPAVASRLRACGKLSYEKVGNILSGLGVDFARVQSPASAAQLYRGGAPAFGVAHSGARERETLQLTTGSALKMFDIFLQAAPEIIGAMPSNHRCFVDGQSTTMFDRRSRCTIDGITCLKGAPASEDERALCDRIVSLASSAEAGKNVAVAAILAAAHTCE